jgi:predicted site-specific integrase-resolvase
MEYVKRKVVLESLKISYQTLYKMAERKEIDSIKIAENTLYNLDKYLREKGIKGGQEKIAYCRVSSNKQKEDLKRQIAYMKDKFPTHRIISDIGSGLNFNRIGLKEIIDKAISGKVEELVVAYKDRLARFGYEMVENIIKIYSKGKIVIINKSEEQTPTEEVTKDIIAIMNVYTAKINGLRKYKSKLKEEINKQ